MDSKDCELLEKAAKAAGMKIHHWSKLLPGPMMVDPVTDDCGGYWNPLDESDDALSLAVQLKISILIGESNTLAADRTEYGEGIREQHGDDAEAATRRAIVRAAAAMGEKL